MTQQIINIVPVIKIMIIFRTVELPQYNTQNRILNYVYIIYNNRMYNSYNKTY